MTARALQKALVKDLEILFRDGRYKVPPENGREWKDERKLAAPGVYEQDLPIQDSGDNSSLFPYIIVRVSSGGIETPTDPHKVAMLLLIGIFDDDPMNRGHEAVLEIIERTQAHYERFPILECFSFTDPFHWALQDEPSYPYYFGAININFDATAPRTEWSELT